MRGSSDKFFLPAQGLINKVLSGDKVAVVSQLVLLETIHALRQKIAENSPHAGSTPEKYGKVQSQIGMMVQDFLNRVHTMARDGKILMVKPNVSVATHYARVLKKSTDYFGYLRTISVCPYCKSGWVGRQARNACEHCGHAANSIQKYSYKGLGHADLEHAFFALSNRVREFHSADKSFDELNRDSDFKNIRFHIIRL